MKKIFVFCIFFTIITACGNLSETRNSEGDESEKSDQNNDPGEEVSGKHAGDFLLDNLLKFNSEKELKEVYGKNVIHTKEWGAEGTEEYHCTRLYPETQNMVEITWKDTIHFTGIQSLKIYGEKSDWRTKVGVELGTSLKELEKLNKKPFNFFGFGWDYGGSVDWDNGFLSDKNIHVSLSFEGEPDDEMQGLMGDMEIKSSLPLAQKTNPIVVEILLSKD
jgi:hypothetical protein